MSGELDDDEKGQLALLDAVVFFLIATTVSAFVWCEANLRGELSEDLAGQTTPRTAEMLSSFLSASISRFLVLELPQKVVIREETTISECISYEAECVLGGLEQSLFAPVNHALEDVLENLAGSSWDPCFEVWHTSEQGTTTVLALPHAHANTAVGYSASCALPLERVSLLAVLVLAPSSPPELAYVTSSQLDLGPGIGQPPANLDPREENHEREANDCGIQIAPVILVDIDQYQRGRYEVQEVEGICHPGVWDLDRRGGSEAHDASVPYRVPALDPEVLAAWAV